MKNKPTVIEKNNKLKHIHTGTCWQLDGGFNPGITLVCPACIKERLKKPIDPRTQHDSVY